jgi:hypothetical protein
VVTPRNRWFGAAAIALVVPAGWALWRLGDAIRDDRAIATFHGVRLGMTPSDVRARCDLVGEFDASTTAEGGEYVLDFSPQDATEAADVRSARFEFHDGLLVAIRAELGPEDPWAEDEGVTVTESTVRETTEQSSGRVRVTLIARNCPTHVDEVRRLLSSH